MNSNDSRDILDCNHTVYAESDLGKYNVLVNHQKEQGITYKGKTLTVEQAKDDMKYTLNYYDTSNPTSYEVKKRVYRECKYVLTDEDLDTCHFIYIDMPLHLLKDHHRVQAYGRNSAGGNYVTTMEWWMFGEVFNSIDHPERFV